MLAKFVDKFWEWYERNLTLNIAIASVLFSWQVIHLAWLFGDVIVFRLFGFPLFHLTGIWEKLILIVDYTEIPALITTGLIYVNRLRKGFKFRNLLFLLLLGSQVFHIFWITDEFIISTFLGGGGFVDIPPFFAWVAILIDYLEVPVMIETFVTLIKRIRKVVD